MCFSAQEEGGGPITFFIGFLCEVAAAGGILRFAHQNGDHGLFGKP
jgi:hypothetical protein